MSTIENRTQIKLENAQFILSAFEKQNDKDRIVADYFRVQFEYRLQNSKFFDTAQEAMDFVKEKSEVITPMSKEEVEQYFEGQVYIENHANEAYIKMSKSNGIAVQVNETKLLDQLIAADDNNVKLAEVVINDQQRQLMFYKARLEALKLKRGR